MQIKDTRQLLKVLLIVFIAFDIIVLLMVCISRCSRGNQGEDGSSAAGSSTQVGVKPVGGGRKSGGSNLLDRMLNVFWTESSYDSIADEYADAVEEVVEDDEDGKSSLQRSRSYYISGSGSSHAGREGRTMADPERDVIRSVENKESLGNPSIAGSVAAAGPVAEEVDDNRIPEVPQVMAYYPGGEESLYKWLTEHIQYPECAKDQGIQGRVMVRFVVEKDGSISNAIVTRSPDEDLSREAIRVVRSMPKWKPARQGSRIVRSYFNLPIMFRLQ